MSALWNMQQRSKDFEAKKNPKVSAWQKVLIAAAVLAFAGSATVASAQSYYVSPTGNDTTGTGSMSAPFATLARAQTAMRASSTIKTTQLLSGTYYLTTPLALTSADNGETWEAASGATPVLSGGVTVTGWTETTPAANETWYAPLSVSPGTDLEIDGQRQMPAVRNFDPNRPFMSGWNVIPCVPSGTACTPPATGQLNVKPADMTASSQKIGALIEYSDSNRYTDYYATVTGYNTTTGTFNLSTGAHQSDGSGSWRIVGDYQDIVKQGQFGYDSVNKVVYVRHPSHCTFEADSVVTVARLTTLITANTVSNLTITGLTFTDTMSVHSGSTDYGGIYQAPAPATIQGTKLTNSNISNNTFTVAGIGVGLVSSTGNTFSYNTFDQMGGSAFILNQQSNNNSITHNTMTALSQINWGAMGIYIQDSAYVTVDSNYLNYVGNNAVAIQLHDQTSTHNLAITNNTFINTSRQNQDTASIYGYAGRFSTVTDISSVISGNRLENTGGLGRDNSGNWGFGQNRGIYTDNLLSGVTITNNVVENDMQGMVMCHGCASNSATNNVTIIQSQPTFVNGATQASSAATGSMTVNGTTSINLVPSYFPPGTASTTVVLQATGTTSTNISPAFDVFLDGTNIGSGSVTPDGTSQQFVFTTNVAERTMHTVAVQLTNGAASGSATQSLNNLLFYINNTPVSLNANVVNPFAGAMAFDANGLNPTHFTYAHNIVYRLTGSGQDLSIYCCGGETDPNPGVVDYNLLWQSLKPLPISYGYTDTHSQVADPLFNNVTIGDYTLKSGSPAFNSTIAFTSTGVPLAPAAQYPTSPVESCTAYLSK